MAKKTPVPRRKACIDLLAHDYWRQRDQIRQASKDLHDHAGSQLAAAGLRLQMLYLDVPQAQPMLTEISEMLAGAMESVRAVSKDLSTSPVWALGFKGALEELADRHGAALKYKTAAAVTREVGDHLYHVTDLVLQQIPPDVRTSVLTSGVHKLTLRIRVGMRLKSVASLAKAEILAKTCGFGFRIDLTQVTMVSIEYAIRRAVG